MLQDREPLPTRVSGLPELPSSYDAVLDDGLARLQLNLSRVARSAIADHVRLMLAWTGAINLTAIRDPEAVAREHVLDSLSAVAVLRARRIDRLLDLGSGGGFPGIPLAAALGGEALLVDSIAKKTRFLETVAVAIGGRVSLRVATVRAEALAADQDHRERWPAVVVRAVARLDALAQLGLPLVRPGGVLVAWKRAPVTGELAEARDAIRRGGGGRTDVLPTVVPGLEDHVLVVIAKEHQAPTARLLTHPRQRSLSRPPRR